MQFLRVAESLQQEGKTQEALTTIDRALEVRPGHVAARVAKARLLIDLGRVGDACSELDEVLALDPTQMVACKLRVEAALMLGHKERAQAELDKYVRLQPADPDTLRLRDEIARLPSPTRSSPSAPPAASGDDDGLVTVTLGRLYLDQGHRREAAAIFQRILHAEPDNRGAREGLAEATGKV